MNPADIMTKLEELVLTHPEAVKAIGNTVDHVIHSKNPTEAARRAALVTASEAAVELALEHVLGTG